MPIQVDGILDDASWADVPWTTDFVDIEGDRRPVPVPRYRTRAKMLWDDQYLYVAAELEEPHVWANLTEHDSIVYHDPDFEIFIDPDHDHLDYYEVEVNPLGTIFDLLLKRTYDAGGPADHDWEFDGMRYAVHIDGTLNDASDTDRGWSVEFALPWTTMAEYSKVPSPPAVGDVWMINFSRVEWQHEQHEGRYRRVPDTAEDNWVWSVQGKINMHAPERWGLVTFAE